MNTVTDPARELAEIAALLTQSVKSPGEQFLASQFGVERWSTDFLKIITCILDRADLVSAIIGRSDMDKDHRKSAQNDLTQFKTAFTGNSLRQQWDQVGLLLVRDHGKPIQYFSQVVRREVRYPKLTNEDVAEFLTLIDRYLAEVLASDEGPDFVRQGIIDGLTAFRFQLERIGWMGAGYAMASFREVMIAYDAAQSQFRSQQNPDAGAFMSGLLDLIKTFKEKVDVAQSWSDSAETVWKVYQIGSAVATPLLLTGTLQLPGN